MAEDKYARGFGLAFKAVFIHTLRALVANGTLPKDGPQKIIQAALNDFAKPNLTDAEIGAAGALAAPLAEL